ncbi:tubulin polyglutamylase complex subunit 2 [Scleropages formosus]|uniref:Tubulin polyglutamylase complex subunit 2 n=1 Tax=Scleropages formosus TaxID=113540 RepID=A0A8C9SGE4_SCLFO|nr:tubulin polyglutamylase complex subunit 2 [Scleropages formosus]
MIMKEVSDVLRFKEYVERLTLGIARVLERLPGVTDVSFVERAPAEKRCLLSWEQKNMCVLPEDLKDFYLTTDGFTLSWSSKLEGEAVPIGSMVINCVAKLCPLTQSAVFSLPYAPTLADLDCDEETEASENHPKVPHFDSRSRIFELDPCSGNGKVCLVYKNCTPGMVAEQSELWFLDRSLYWHYVTSSFTSYYRLMISHLGLPEWQYSFTSYGPSPQAKQWACLYQPFTFQCDSHIKTSGDLVLNKLDPSRAFQGKMKQQVQKKKTPVQSGGCGGGGGGGGGTGGIQKGSGRHTGIKR